MIELPQIPLLLWPLLTIGLYVIALRIHKKCRGNMLLHPLVVAVLLVAVSLWLTQTSVVLYQQYTASLHWMLGPVTVALAIPLRNQLPQLTRYWRYILVSIVVGGTVGPLLAALTLYFSGLEMSVVSTILTKSITTPLAMDTAFSIGGYPSLAAVLVILSGIIGAVCCATVFKIINVRSEIAQGIALGTAAHAVGTAQAFHISEKTGAFASLALCINGLLTAIFLPLLYVYLS